MQWNEYYFAVQYRKMSVCPDLPLHGHFLSILLLLLSQVSKLPAAEASLSLDPTVLDAANVR